jgi:hypothetical protein
MAHVMNLSVQCILNEFRCAEREEDELDEGQSHLAQFPLSKIQSQIRKIRKSDAQFRGFKAIATSMGFSSPRMPKIDVATRWNSTFLMLDTAIEYREVHDVHCDIQKWTLLKLSDDEWLMMQRLKNCLKPYFEATLQASGSSYLTVSRSVVLYEYLLNRNKMNVDLLKTQEIINSRLITAMNKGHHKLVKYYDRMAVITILCTVLDPKKGLKIFSDFKWNIDWIAGVRIHLSDAFSYYSSEAEANLAPRTSPIDVVDHFDNSCSSAKTGDIDTFLASLANSSAGNTVTPSNDLEMERYLENTPLRKDDPTYELSTLEWWKCQKHIYPVLSLMARDYLSVQATSVPCEELFSSGVDLVTPDRNRLKEDSITACMSLKYWLKQK